MSATVPKRARIACVPCREQKRKCDGSDPCDTCKRYGHECRYAARVQQAAASPPTKKIETVSNGIDDTTYQRSRAANSGPSFVRQLVRNIDPVDAPKLKLCAWNVGSRWTPDPNISGLIFAITDLLSLDQMVALARAYFAKVDPCYSFMDRNDIFLRVQDRWSVQYSVGPTDALLCGIAALGSFFSKRDTVSVEPQLVSLAKSILDQVNPSQMSDPSVLTAWVCRVIYLRMASEPLTAWLASCTTMHVLEATGLHQVSHREEAVSEREPSRYAPQIRRRLFGVAQHLNTWISYDLGTSRVSLKAPDIPPASVPAINNYTEKLLELLPISLSLDPSESYDDLSLRSALVDLASKTDPQPPLIMAQCNVMLCILRRLSGFDTLRRSDDHVLEVSLRFLARGLKAARQMVDDDCPWHQLANVPFQIFCILLAIDTQSSLRIVDQAMQTILCVARAYDTATLRDACSTARLVLRLHRKRRLEDAEMVDKVLAKSADVEGSAPDDEERTADWVGPNETELTWIHNLMAEFPSLQSFGPLDGTNLTTELNDLPG